MINSNPLHRDLALMDIINIWISQTFLNLISEYLIYVTHGVNIMFYVIITSSPRSHKLSFF